VNVLWTGGHAPANPALARLWGLYRRVMAGLVRLRWGDYREIAVPDVPIDEAEAAHTAERLSLAWADGLDLTYHGVALPPLLLYKVAGYNVHLSGLVRMARKAQAMLDTARPSTLLLAESALLPQGVFAEALAAARDIPVRRLIPGPLARLGRQAALAVLFRVGYEPDEVPLFEVWPHSQLAADEPPAAVLFVASMNNYLTPMLPVMRALQERGRCVVVVVPRAAAGWGNYGALRAAAPVIFAEDLLDDELAAEIAARRREYGRLFRGQRARLRERLRLDASCSLDLWPFAGPGMRVVFERLLPHAVGYVSLAERAYCRFEPRVVVLARQRRAFENAFAAVARRDGIPTALVIHGHVSSQPIYHFIDGYLDQADLVCAWGAAQHQALVEKGADPARVVVTGNPAWDRLAGGLDALPDRAVCRTAVAEQLGLDPARFWVTFTSQADSRAFFPAILGAVRALPDANLVVKVHPGEQVADYPVPAEARAGCRVVKRTDLHTLLRASDVVLTYTSTTNLEALMAGAPLVVVDLASNPDMPNRIDLAAYGVPEVRDEATLRETLTRLRADEGRRQRIVAAGARAVADYAYRMDGQSAARVADALEQMMKE